MRANLIEDRVEMSRQGVNLYAVCRLPSGWLVMGDVQPLSGYCLLLSDPVVPSLNDLDDTGRALYSRDVARIGDALLKVTGATRINYETLGNAAPALHTHITPRYANEPAWQRGMAPAFLRLFARRFDPARDSALAEKLRLALAGLR
ncbi:HIT family protein [Asticcacaulis solisilvae]|uniref:HIT family protein n=1 Tax=Asticcacaulis solisilvae TaxID=1217274 RepID=UPI003FD809D9